MELFQIFINVKLQIVIVSQNLIQIFEFEQLNNISREVFDKEEIVRSLIQLRLNLLWSSLKIILELRNKIKVIVIQIKDE